MNTEKTPDPDWDRITELGGPTKVAELLGYGINGGPQRVQNWKFRGVPPLVKLERPDLFPTVARIPAASEPT